VSIFEPIPETGPTASGAAAAASGPLAGIRVVELAGVGPGPFCAMLLADLGADVLRVDRASVVVSEDDYQRPPDALLNRSRRSIGVDLKHPDGVELVLALAERAHVLMEGFRPGVCERLGVGPDVCLERNPALVYGRMTGWGQSGPLAQQPGHDINYLALSGVLHAIGAEGGPPIPPLNVVGDFGGGGMLLAFGIACALLQSQRTGRGQVVDATMVDGAALLGTMLYGMRGDGHWPGPRGTNLLDGGAPFYAVYETADGRYVSVGALEPQFYAELLRVLGFDPAEMPEQMDRAHWASSRRRFAERFATATRDEWCERFAEAEACFAPVLAPDEVADHPHNRDRGVFLDREGLLQPGVAPRFSETPGAVGAAPPRPGQHTDLALADWGFGPHEVARLRDLNAIS
jgi:alpha-methylacyl-CoA racemase